MSEEQQTPVTSRGFIDEMDRLKSRGVPIDWRGVVDEVEKAAVSTVTALQEANAALEDGNAKLAVRVVSLEAEIVSLRAEMPTPNPTPMKRKPPPAA